MLCHVNCEHLFSFKSMTKKQTLVYEFIRAYFKVHGCSPSYEEIARGLGLKSRSNVHRMLHKMRREGMVSLKVKKYRSLQLNDRSVQNMVSL